MRAFGLSIAVALLVGLSHLIALSEWATAAEPNANGTADSKTTAADPEFSAHDLEFFEKQVRPLLVARCFECHASDAKHLKGGLKLDSRSAVLAGGDTGPAALSGKADESLLVDAIRYGNLYQMPPKSKLPAEEIAVLEKWVNLGLPWPKESTTTHAEADLKKFDLAARRAAHWAWQPVKQVEVPQVNNPRWLATGANGAGEVSTNIDRFIVAKLTAAGLTPAPTAEKSQLLRRVYFDLIGLPPSAEEVRRFMGDDSPQALAKVIDELLASPHFGERWGRHWLDLVRYAESRGHEFDYTIPNVWQYRDYVIQAFNADVPYNDFVREHIAGDLLHKPRLNKETGANESILGTGFWFLGEWVHSPVDIRKDETDRLDNMIDVATKTFLGLTVACARCHDHKFDAISQADYYALAGYLKSSSYRLACFESMENNRQVAEQWAALDAKYAPQLAQLLMESYSPVLKQLDKYLLGARAVLQAVPDAGKPDAVVADVLGTPEELRQEEATRIAKELGLQPDVLHAWVEVLRVARDEPDHPLHPFALVVTAKDEAISVESIAKQLEPVVARLSAREAGRENALTGARIVVDYAKAGPTEFLPDDASFGMQPKHAGELLLGDRPGQPITGVQRFSAAKRAAVWAKIKPAAGAENDPGRMAGWMRAGQTLRTPSFTLNSGRLFYLVEGTGNIYANVSSHITNNGPLHGQLLSRFETKPGTGPAWVEQNLSTYAGNMLHVEFTPAGNQDCSILMVVESDRTPGPFTTSNQLLLDLLKQKHESLADLAKGYQTLFESLAAELGSNQMATADSPAAKADLADWLVAQPKLFQVADSPAREKLQHIGDEYQTARKELLRQIKPESQLAMAMQEGSGQDELLLIRGNSRTPGELVPRRFLSALGGAGNPTSNAGSGRLLLADQMVSPENPLTSRVMVNRLWHHLLGRGIVSSVDNFGKLGEKPTHPELLDYLSGQFVKQGWSVKQMIRAIMLSQTYQMASQHQAEADKQDPANLLWHRANVRRLEGEAIRDSLLAVSGRLDRTQFGPSVPVHLTEFLQGRGRPESGPVDGAGRRSIYISIRRNFLSPMMLAFDVPIPFTTVGRRNVSNVPAQALILMNDPLVVEQAKLWARRILAEPNQSQSERIERMYLEAFARVPTETELTAAKGFFEQQATELKLSQEQSLNNEPLWADFAHVLFNAKEFIFLQ